MLVLMHGNLMCEYVWHSGSGDGMGGGRQEFHLYFSREATVPSV
jgi:hypothetical protein